MGLINNKKILNYVLDEFWGSVTVLGTPIFYFFTIALAAYGHPNLHPVKVLFGFVVLEILCFFLKMLIPKARPGNALKKVVSNIYDERSFPSIHAARISFLAVVLFTVMPGLVLLYVGAIVLVGYSRIYTHKHDLWDVVGGTILGLLFGLIWNII